MNRLLIIILNLCLGFLVIFNTTASALTYSLSDVATHNTPTDCWMIFENGVYNITNYLQSHDKYLDIRAWCGKDMTVDFKTKAGEGVDHKSSTYTLLSAYKIGDYTTTAPTTVVSTTTDNSATEDDLYSVEIEGQAMKALSIQQIADLWGIDSNQLLTEIIKEFSLKGTYSTSTILDTMRLEYKFSPAQIKDIAEGIKNGTIIAKPVDTVSQRTNSNPYNFVVPFIGVIVLYWPTYFYIKRVLIKKHPRSLINFNFIWNTVLLVGLIPSVAFGFYMIFRYSIPELNNVNFDFTWWHVEGSIVFGTVAFSHLLQRLTQYLVPLKIIKRAK